MITYRVEVQGLDSLQQRFAKAPGVTQAKLRTATHKSLVKLQGTAKQLAPVDRGTLSSSILIQPLRVSKSAVEGEVSTELDYARYMEEGTGIYGPKGTPIRPRTKKVLAWKTDGTWHFARQVRGARPRWYMRGSVERNQAAIDGYYATAANEIAAYLAGGRSWVHRSRSCVTPYLSWWRA